MFVFVCHKAKKRQFITSLKERVSLHAFKKILTASKHSENLIDRSKFLVFFITKALHQSFNRIFSEYA